MNKYWIWLSIINIIGAREQNRLLEKYKTPEAIWNLRENELIKILSDKYVQIILDKKHRNNLEKYIEYMQKHNIKMITIQDKEYPQKLRNIYDPPVVLYAKGNIDILNGKSLAIIGSRECSEYGKKVAKQLAYNLSKQNINIISGLAKGIDTYAHKGAVKNKKNTIAVMGNGLDVVYPKENIRLI